MLRLTRVPSAVAYNCQVKSQTASACVDTPARADFSEAAQAPGRTYLPALDGLRGLAILSVLLFHFAPYVAPDHAVTSALSYLRSSCWAGVDLFFVLSGFLITGILLDAKHKPHYYRNFLARRTLRIFPLYLGVLAVAILLLPSDGPIPSSEATVRTQNSLWAWLYAMNLAVPLNQSWYFRIHHLNVSHFWSLAVEEHFYLIWPAVVWFCRPRQLAWICGSLVAAALVSRLVLCIWLPPVALYVLTPCRMDGLAIGGLVALAARRPIGLTHLAGGARIVALSVGGLVALLFAMGGGELLGLGYSPLLYFTATAGYTLLALTFAAILVVTLTSQGFMQRVCCSGLLRFFGVYSYGLYVFHGALAPAYHALIPWLGYHEYIHSTTVKGVVDMILQVFLSLAIAVLSYHLYEKHFLWFKRFFVTSTERRPRAELGYSFDASPSR
jgi:peptidoglycan/LPS O-acetylase OafA/YrhL